MNDEQVLPFNVGIAPDAPIILHDVRPKGRRRLAIDPATTQTGGLAVSLIVIDELVDLDPATNDRPASHDQNPPKLALVGGREIVFGPLDPPVLVGVSGEPINPLTWVEYAAWRRTKCRPYDHIHAPACATAVPPGAFIFTEGRDRALEEIDQATHELVGEVGELGELVLEHGPAVFYGELRTKLIDECGDIFFCALWALDAWGVNPLDDADLTDLELLRVEGDDNPLAVFAAIMVNVPADKTLTSKRFVSDLMATVIPLVTSTMTGVCLTSNSFKKLRFQRRQQSVEKQVERIVSSLFTVNQILIIANSSVEEALLSNQRKLNARFPLGYQPGVGGGIRTGEGK